MANPYVNKVVFGGETVVDLTGDTATAADVAEGKTFHLASGAQAVGTASSGGGTGSSVFYGTCATVATTAAKVVVCEEFTADDIVEGTVLFVKFANANTYNGIATLNVNSTGAKPITRVVTQTSTRYYWSAGELISFVYDGTNWLMQGRGTATTSYYGLTKLSSSTSSTSTAWAATPSAVKAAYDLANGKQDALVSGSNIKTINGNSILGSGDLAISGGGGASVTTASVTIAASDWLNNTCTKSVSGVTASNNVLVTYAPASKAAYTAADIYCTAQGSGTLTFACSAAPTESVTVNVLVIDAADGGSTITFYVKNDMGMNATYEAEEGMTWTQWVDSNYNTDGYEIYSNEVGIGNGVLTGVLPTDTIVNEATYRLAAGSN